ncbi:hypothetical protein BYT27DRAFT_7207061 [Phlegmacium glaucopus]|nr:hypothetical protein BYT27DRAFT_7259277 [Phlegmacium glaucopus]KAF8816654.1 hypothetical protein BYT27DRAFT_7207061 [Phlegmacium glaucopus]
MAISNIPMPSFTLALTSGHCSHRRHPTTFDTCVLLPSAPGHLMKTVDLRGEPEDDRSSYTEVPTTSVNQEYVHLPTIFEETEPSSSGNIAKEAGNPIKANLLAFLRKFVFKRLVKKMSSST